MKTRRGKEGRKERKNERDKRSRKEDRRPWFEGKKGSLNQGNADMHDLE